MPSITYVRISAQHCTDTQHTQQRRLLYSVFQLTKLIEQINPSQRNTSFIQIFRRFITKIFCLILTLLGLIIFFFLNFVSKFNSPLSHSSVMMTNIPEIWENVALLLSWFFRHSNTVFRQISWTSILCKISKSNRVMNCKQTSMSLLKEEENINQDSWLIQIKGIDRF